MTAASETHARTRNVGQLLQVLELGSDPAVIIVGGRIAFVNEAFSNLTGIQPAKLDRENPLRLIAANAPHGMRREVLLHAARQTAWDGALTINCAGRETVQVRVNLLPLCDERGAPVTVLIGSGTAPTATELLEMKRRLAALQKLVGSVAHSLNNHLTIVHAHVNVALTTPTRILLEPELRDIDKAVRLSSNLLTQLMGGGRQPRRPKEQANAADLVAGAIHLTTGLLPKTIDLQIDVDRESGIVNIENGTMEDIILNLVTNARDAMSSGGCLHVSVSPFIVQQILRVTTGPLKPGAYVRVSVRDTGDGISPEILPQIFNPFFSTKGDGDGYGLGMYSIKEQVERLGGRVNVDSAPGTGTMIDFYIPTIS